jgi:hypothetical protein
MCIIIMQDVINISGGIKTTDRKVIIMWPSLAFGREWCGCQWYTLTQYAWGSLLPTEETSLWWIKICVRWPFLKYGQRMLASCAVWYRQKETLQRELIQGSLSTMLTNMDAWRARIWQELTTWRMDSTLAIMVRLQSVHLNGNQWASQPIVYP